MSTYASYLSHNHIFFTWDLHWKFLWSIDGKKYQTLVLDRTKSVSLMP